MTPRTTDNLTFWQLVAQHLRAGTRDNYGATPMVPANIMLKLAERIWERRRGR
jgi:hypothetical protein